jgi:hypothetical protein
MIDIEAVTSWREWCTREPVAEESNRQVRGIALPPIQGGVTGKSGGTLMGNKPAQIIRKLVLLRHGESVWNEENRFCGWTDVDLYDRGKSAGQNADRELKEPWISFDIAFTSVLIRAIRTVWITLDEMVFMWIPVHRKWGLNP